MTDDTPNLNMPYLIAAQAQKHVTHNEALRVLDAVVQLSVKDKDLATPPVSPVNGDRYIVAASPAGGWSGQAGRIAAFQDNAWMIYRPQPGWLAWVADEDKLYAFDGTDWIAYASGLTVADLALGAASKAGINTAADDTNRLAVKSDAVLFSHDDVTPGNGSIQAKLNKARAGMTASVLFQNNWSGRAEIGLAGDDDFHFKVSPDGASWAEGLILDKDDGKAAFPSGTRHALSGADTNMLIQTPGGTGVTTIWRFDAPRTGIPRMATVSSVSGDRITLSEPRANEFLNNQSMQNVSYVHIWNASKVPEEDAWLRAGAPGPYNATYDLYVTDPADIAGWASGDQLRLGEPVGAFGGVVASPNAVALDISPMMQRFFGTVFRQSGLLVAMTASTDGSTGGWLGQIAATPDASSGSFVSVYTPNDGALTQGFSLIGATIDSPISNSRLVLVRELDDGSGAMAVGALAIKGLYV